MRYPIDPEERNHGKFDLDAGCFEMHGKACDAPDAEAAVKRYGR